MEEVVQESEFNLGLDAAILMNPRTWVASGHVVNFNDPLIDCRACKMRRRLIILSRIGTPQTAYR